MVKCGLGILAQRPYFGHGREQGIAVTGSLWKMPFWSKVEQEQGVVCVFTIWHEGHFWSKDVCGREQSVRAIALTGLYLWHEGHFSQKYWSRANRESNCTRLGLYLWQEGHFGQGVVASKA